MTPPPPAEALKFFDWAYKNGKDQAKALDYVAIPDAVVALIEKSWSDDPERRQAGLRGAVSARNRNPKRTRSAPASLPDPG